MANLQSTPVNLLELPEDFDFDLRRLKVEFEIDDEDTPPGKRVDVGDMGKTEDRSVPETGSLALLDIESSARR